MNILIFGNGTLFVGDQEKKICSSIAELGHKVYLVSHGNVSKFETSYEEKNNFEILNIPNYNHKLLNIDHSSIDFVLGIDQSVAPFVAEYKRIYSKPSYCIFLDLPLHVIDGTDAVNYNFNYAQRFYYWINCALELDNIIFINQYVANKFEEIYKRKPLVINFAVTEDFGDIQEEKSDYISSCGSLVPYKGMSLLIDALRRLPYSWKHITASDVVQFKKHVEIILKDRVEILHKLGDREKMIVMSCSKIFVYPQISEWMGGLVPIEAMSVHTPVVCFDYPIFRELYEDSVLYAKKKSILDLRAKINLLYDDKDLYKEMQNRGYELFKRRYTRKTMSKNLINIFCK